MLVSQARKLAKKYSQDELVSCINEQIKQGTNSCYFVNASDPAIAHNETINLLSQATTLRQLLDQGKTMREALRELGRKMRRVVQMNK